MFDKKKQPRTERVSTRQRPVANPPLVQDSGPKIVTNPRALRRAENSKRRELFRKSISSSGGNKRTNKYETWDTLAIQSGLKGSDYYRSLRYAKDLNQGLLILEKYTQGVTVFGSRFSGEGEFEYEQARELGRLLAVNQQTVVTGGGPGIMEAANRGAFEAGGVSLGLNIHLPMMDETPNTYTNDSVTFHYFFARKVMLVAASKMFVFFPGGFGTLDELTEVLVLLQEKKIMPAPVFLVGSKHWKPFDDYLRESLEARGFLNPGDLDIYKIVDDIEVIVNTAKAMPKNLIVNNFTDMQ